MPILDASLLGLLVICGTYTAMSRNLYGSALLLGFYSVILAIIWALWGGLDVAFTEAVVGSGAATIFFITLLWLTNHKTKPHGLHRSDIGIFSLLILLIVGGAWLLLDLPYWGNPDAAAHTYVSPYYLTHALKETHTPNVVSAVLADYRSFDTLLETAVIFAAAMACWLLGTKR